MPGPTKPPRKTGPAKAAAVPSKAATPRNMKQPVKVAPPDRRREGEGPPTDYRSMVDGLVKRSPVIGQIIEKLDEVTRKMGR